MFQSSRHSEVHPAVRPTSERRQKPQTRSGNRSAGPQSKYPATTGLAVGDLGTIIKTTTGGILVGIEPPGNEIPNEHSLSQNYPNPFNPSTIIKFEIPKSSNVTISVYDVLGNELKILVNENLKPGTYKVEWDASNYPSGIYFYRLTAGTFAETKKMVLIK